MHYLSHWKRTEVENTLELRLLTRDWFKNEQVIQLNVKATAVTALIYDIHFFDPDNTEIKLR